MTTNSDKMAGVDHLNLYESIIDEVEIQISLIKKENQQFIENIDLLGDTVYENEEKNKVRRGLFI
jgi:hypothetical protein